ncbi:hypothetical protein ACWATR_37400, partial [Nostoc sp. UIC 10890]
RNLFAGQQTHHLTLSQLLKNYHRFRIARLFLGQGTAVDEQDNLELNNFYGAIGVSFLVKA